MGVENVTAGKGEWYGAIKGGTKAVVLRFLRKRVEDRLLGINCSRCVQFHRFCKSN